MLALIGTATVLFFGSAIVSGVMESNQRHADTKKAAGLTGLPALQKMMLEAARKRPSTATPCWYVGAIAYRLAEARDLKIDKAFAIEASNERYLIEDLTKHGFDTHAVISGLAQRVYSSPLPPQAMFDSQVEACRKN